MESSDLVGLNMINLLFIRCETNYKIKMDANQARRLGSLLLLDAPEGMQFGIDNQIW